MDYSGISNNPNDNRRAAAPPAAPSSPLAQEYANAIAGNPDLFSARTGHTPFFSPVSGSAWQNDGSGVSAYNASFGGKDYLFMPGSGRENSGGTFQTKFSPQQLAQLGGTEVSGPSVSDGTYNAGGYLFGRDAASGGFKTPGGQVVGPSQLRGLSGYSPGTANGKDTFNALAQVLSPALIPLGGAGVLGGAVGGGAVGAAANSAGIGAGIGAMGEDPAKGAILGGIGGAIKGGFGLGGAGSPSVTGEVDGVGYGGIGAVPGGMDIPAGTTAGGLSATGADLSVGGAFPAESGANPIPIGSADYADAAATPGGAQNVANFLGGSSVGTQTGFGETALNAEQAGNLSGIAGGGADGPFSGTFENLPEAIKQFAQSKFALPAAGLAANLLLGNRGIPESGALAGSQNLQGNALAQMKNAQAGNISPAQQTMVAKFRTDSISQASQYLTNAGMGGIHKDPKTGQMTADSSAGLDMLQKIEANAQALQQGFADQLFSQSLQQLGVSDAATSTLIKLRLSQQQQTGQALSNFMLAYAYLEGRGGSGGGHG